MTLDIRSKKLPPWQESVIDSVKSINEEKGHVFAIDPYMWKDLPQLGWMNAYVLLFAMSLYDDKEGNINTIAALTQKGRLKKAMSHPRYKIIKNNIEDLMLANQTGTGITVGKYLINLISNGPNR